MKKIITISILLLVLFIATSSIKASEIHEAVMSGDIEKVKELLEKNPELINVKNNENPYLSFDETPLMVALLIPYAEKREEMVRFLVEQGANVNDENYNGKTPLIMAVEHNAKDIIKFLIEEGADVNAKDGQWETPLMFAVEPYKYLEISLFLVEQGADVNAKNVRGETPLIIATKGDNICNAEGTIILTPPSEETLNLLISEGADVNAKTEERITPLMYAARMGNIKILQLLIEHGADVNAKDNTDRTLLHWALTDSIYDPCALCCNASGFIKLKRHNFDKEAELKLFEFLLSLGIDINSKDKNGRTPLNCAEELGDTEIMEFLVAHGGVTSGESFKDFVDRGTELYDKDKYEEAIKYFTKALELNPENPENCEVWIKKGDAFYNLGKYEKASGCYNEAMRYISTYSMRGKIYFHKGKALNQLSRYWDALCYFNVALDESYEGDPIYQTIEKEKSKTEQILLSLLPVPDTEPVLPEMVYIEGGTFMMGSEKGEDDEKPLHRVKLDGFYLGKYEVTNKEYCIFLNSNFTDPSCDITQLYQWSYLDDNFGIMPIGDSWRVKEKYENRPVVGVTWYAAISYCKWLSMKTGLKYRLPSEAEWEYACRAGTTTEYYWGDEMDYTYDRSDIYETGKIEPNPWGLYDMTWNVFEWCNDWYGTYPAEDVYNPEGPSSGSVKTIRGGALYTADEYCRSSNREYNSPDCGTDLAVFAGFRLARSK